MGCLKLDKRPNKSSVLKVVHKADFLQKEKAANQLDYGARFYDPAIGRITGVDPLADSPNNNYMAPYHFVANNPISNIDPDGLDWFSHTDDDGNTSTLWVDSSDGTYISQDGTSYTNIGTSYTETLSDGTAVVYNQNEVAGVYTPEEQADALSNFESVQQLFGEEFDIKFEAWDSDDQQLMETIYSVANMFGVNGDGVIDSENLNNLQRDEEETGQIYPLPRNGGSGNDGSLGAHKRKKQSTGSKKRLNDKHNKKRSGDTSSRNRKNQRRGNKNRKYTPKKNPNKRK